jgi:hypothetical protein
VNLRKFEVLPVKNGSMFIYGGKSESKRSVKKNIQQLYLQTRNDSNEDKGQSEMQAINYEGKPVYCCHLLENAEGKFIALKNVVHIRFHQSCLRFRLQPKHSTTTVIHFNIQFQSK